MILSVFALRGKFKFSLLQNLDFLLNADTLADDLVDTDIPLEVRYRKVLLYLHQFSYMLGRGFWGWTRRPGHRTSGAPFGLLFALSRQLQDAFTQLEIRVLKVLDCFARLLLQGCVSSSKITLFCQILSFQLRYLFQKH